MKSLLGSDFMKIYEAIQLAIKAHQDQYRKLDGDIYAAHPIEVGIMLASHNFDEEVVIAGILHDTVEDTEVTLEDILEQFGERVHDLVKGCSERDKSLSWKERKIDALRVISLTNDNDVKAIFLADKLSNIKSMIRYMENGGTRDIWTKFNAGFEDQKWYFTEALRVLNTLDDLDMYQDLKLCIEKLFYL